MTSSERAAFADGLRDAVPVMVSFVFLFLGVGAASRAAGLDAAQSTVLTIGVFAAPAQVAIVDSLGSGAWLAVLLTTAVVNFRFALMSAALLPHISSAPRGQVLAALPMLAITTFTVTWTGLRAQPQRPVFHYYLGTCLACYPLAVVMTLVGHQLAGRLDDQWVQPMAMILPIYFTIMLSGSLPHLRPIAAAATGFIAVPLLTGPLGHGALAIAAVGIGALFALLPAMESSHEH